MNLNVGTAKPRYVYLITIRFLLASIVLVLMSFSVLVSGKSTQKNPNIVLVMVDNFGWGELGVYGGGVLHGAATPRIDNLAAQGLMLTNYNVETVCTMSRAALMTGRYGIRTGALYPNRNGISATAKARGLTRWEVTIAETLAEQGYVSGLFGKWHLGEGKGRLPGDQGFDEWYGIADNSGNIFQGNLHPVQAELGLSRGQYVLKGQGEKPPEKIKPFTRKDRALIDKEATDQAIDFMKRQVKKKQPFLAYIPYIETHLPASPHPDFIGKTGNGSHADVLAQVDHYVGRLLDAVSKLGIRDNTIFIFTSDNGSPHSGPWDAGDAQGVFAAKEGALRVPFIVRWPQHIAEGRFSNEIVHQMDLFPTLAKIAGARIPSDRPIDGVDQTDFLTGKKEKSNRDSFVIYSQEKLLGVKWRNWKMITHPEKIKQYVINNTMNMEEFGIIHDLLIDRKEQGPSGAGWVKEPAGQVIADHLKTLEKYPPVPVGAADPYLPEYSK